MKALTFLIPVFYLLSLGCNELQPSQGIPDDEISFTWIERSSGMQCSDPFYNNLEEAEHEISQKGIAIDSSRTISYGVCAACGCPNSTHYQLKIDSSKFSIAEDMGWRKPNR